MSGSLTFSRLKLLGECAITGNRLIFPPPSPYISAMWTIEDKLVRAERSDLTSPLSAILSHSQSPLSEHSGGSAERSCRDAAPIEPCAHRLREWIDRRSPRKIESLPLHLRRKRTSARSRSASFTRSRIILMPDRLMPQTLRRYSMRRRIRMASSLK